MESTPRGLVLIVNISKYKPPGPTDRNGSDVDLKSLRDIFKMLDFECIECLDSEATKKNILTKIKYLIEDEKLKKKEGSCCMVIIMSHGQRHVISTFDDEMDVEKDIISKFENQNSPHLIGIPKIFIIQACRGDNEFPVQSVSSKIEMDNSYEQLNPTCDSAIIYATIPGFPSHRDVEDGSWLIQSFCEALKRQAGKDHILEIFAEVQKSIVEKKRRCDDDTTPVQVPEIVNRGLTKKLYFNPDKWEFPTGYVPNRVSVPTSVIIPVDPAAVSSSYSGDTNNAQITGLYHKPILGINDNFNGTKSILPNQSETRGSKRPIDDHDINDGIIPGPFIKAKYEENNTISSLQCGKISHPVKVRLLYKADRFKGGANKNTPFKFLFIDSTGEIGGIAFGAEGYNIFQKVKPNKCYTITDGKVTTTGENHISWDLRMQICINHLSHIKEIDDDSNIPFKMKLNFTSFTNTNHLKNDDGVDLIGIVDFIQKATPRARKEDGTKYFNFKDISLKNEVGDFITCRLYGNHISKVKKKKCIFLIKGAKVKTSGHEQNDPSKIVHTFFVIDTSIAFEVTDDRVIPIDQLVFYTSLAKQYKPVIQKRKNLRNSAPNESNLGP